MDLMADLFNSLEMALLEELKELGDKRGPFMSICIVKSNSTYYLLTLFPITKGKNGREEKHSLVIVLKLKRARALKIKKKGTASAKMFKGK